MIEIKTADEIELMRHAGRITAAALAAVRDAAAVGVRLDALDEVAADVIADAGAEALFFGYQPGSARTPYPGVTCISVNDAVVHGIPGRYRLAAGRPRLRRLRSPLPRLERATPPSRSSSASTPTPGSRAATRP